MLGLLLELASIALTIFVCVKWPITFVVLITILLLLNAIDSWKTNKVATILDVVVIILIISITLILIG